MSNMKATSSVNVEQAVELLHGLVAQKSLSGQEREASGWLVERMDRLGFRAVVDDSDSAVGVREKLNAAGTIEREIVLLGHIDTVPGEIPVRIEDGVLHGRGSVDAKGPLATFVMAGALTELPAGTRLVVIGASEEESATSKGARHALENYRPDYCIIGEPSNWDAVTLGYKGRLLIDYFLEREMGHTAGELEGAAESGVAFYNALISYVSKFNSERPRLFDQLLPSIRKLQTKSDGLTDRVDIKLGIRLPPEFAIDEFKATIEDLAGEGVVEFSGYEAAYSSSRTSKLARTFNRVLLQRGVKPRFKRKTGTADLNVVGPVWQCPIVAYGPGDSRLDHTPHEHLEIAEYLKAIDVLKEVLEQLP